MVGSDDPIGRSYRIVQLGSPIGWVLKPPLWGFKAFVQKLKIIPNRCINSVTVSDNAKGRVKEKGRKV